MGKVYNKKNVYDASLERIEYIFNEFDNVYFSFSGGKDSLIMVQIADVVAKKIGRTFDVLFVDLEGNYKSTINGVKKIKELETIRDFYWVTLPLKLRNGVSNLQTHWVCWDKEYHKNHGKWIRSRPSIGIDTAKAKKLGWCFFKENMQFEDFIIDFATWYSEKYGKVACGVGIRADESFNRFRTIISDKKTRYDDKNYTTLIKATKKEVYNFYPIYDFSTEDVWVATFKYNFIYNYFYEVMYKAGKSIHETRLCQPYGDDQRDGLDQFKIFEPETWGKVLMRVNGANFGNIYSKTTALGNSKVIKPDELTYQQYAVFLLESIGTINYDLMLHYAYKIKKFINFYKKENIEIIDKGDKSLESKKQIATWRRVCKMLLKNDYYGKQLSFSQTKKDDVFLDELLKKWGDIL